VSGPRILTCRELVEFILDYLEGGLTEEQRRLFEHHLSLCADCTRYLATYRRTVELGRKAFDPPDGPCPDDVPEELVKAILEAKRRRG